MNTDHTSIQASDDGPVIVAHGTELPPPPPGVRYVTVNFVGIIIADDSLRLRIARRFHWPMIVLALLVLPFLAIELFAKPAESSAIGWVIYVGLGIIWLAFLIEFVVKIAIAECRIEYARRNWLDIIIIIVPILRPLRIASLGRTARVFTLRGVGMKFLSYMFTIVIGLEATDRLLERIGLKGGRNRQDLRQMTRHELTEELKKRRRLCDEWDAWYESHQAYLLKIGFDPFKRSAPSLPEPSEATLATPRALPPAQSPETSDTPATAPSHHPGSC